MNNIFISIIIILITTIILSCSDDKKNLKETQTIEINKQIVTINGLVVDGYISNALVCIDSNLNSMCEYTEFKSVTSLNGQYIFNDIEIEQGSFVLIVASGGVDTSIKTSFQGKLKRIISDEDFELDDNINITPLTDLVASIFISSDVNSLERLIEIKKTISKSFDINESYIDSDPMLKKKIYSAVQLIQQIKRLIFTSALKSYENNISNYESKILYENIVKSISISSYANKTILIADIISKLSEIDSNIYIPENESHFLALQIEEIRNYLGLVITDESILEAELGHEQLKLERKIVEIIKIINEAESNSSIQVVTINEIQKLLFPPSIPSLD